MYTRLSYMLKLIMILLLIFSCTLFSQYKDIPRHDEPEAVEYKSYLIGVTSSFSGVYESNYINYGITFKYFINQNISLNLNYNFGVSDDTNIWHINGLPTILGFDDFSFNNSNGEGLLLVITLALFPEGISYYIPLEDGNSLSLNLNPFGSEFREGANDYNLSYDFSVQYNLRLSSSEGANYFQLSPYLGYRGLYNGDFGGLIGGAILSYSF